MTHRVVISRAIADIFADPDVQAQLTPPQRTKVENIITGTQPCDDEDFRYLVRKLTKVYCEEDE